MVTELQKSRYQRYWASASCEDPDAAATCIDIIDKAIRTASDAGEAYDKCITLLKYRYKRRKSPCWYRLKSRWYWFKSLLT